MSNETIPLDPLIDAVSPIAAGVVKAAAGGAASGVRDTAADIWGALVGDRVKHWRVRNFTTGLEKTAEHVKSLGVDLANAKPLPYGDMLVLFDGVSKEDDLNLSDMWARLIAKAMTEKEGPSVSSRSVAAVLEQLSPDSARVFLLLAKVKRSELLNAKLNRIRNKDFFPLADEEKNLNGEELNTEYDQLSIEIEGEWKTSNLEGAAAKAKFEVSKAELLRLNLIHPKKVEVHFNDSPFRDGVMVNSDGLDKVVSDLIRQFQELVDRRTLSAERPFLKEHTSASGSNFELTEAGMEIAKKLDFL
ncbi:Abi-alpha family protein [Tritonibacter mobilis]|uniref:Abi-alpha family protein n=1 Tax=Tritonibacter mobilis TaxID=379347 RepID=UPI0008069E9E|nr:hypothetical protein [Tritonibacter mobilis]